MNTKLNLSKLLPDYEKGYNTEGDVLTQTLDNRDLNEIWAEFNQTLLAWNAGRDTLVSNLTFAVTNPVEDVPQVSNVDFEVASEFGVPVGVRGGDYFSLGYDFEWYDVAKRFTWKYLAEATSGQVESIHNAILEADNRLLFTKVMGAIFNNVNSTADIRKTSFPVYRLYNNDGTVPPDYEHDTFASTHNHYLVTGGAAVDSGDLDDMENHLVHHGYGRQAGSQMIMLVNRADLATIRTFRVATGDSYDFIGAAGQAPWLLPTSTGGIVTPQGSSVPSQVNGMQVSGVYGPWVIIESGYIPSKYMLGYASGGVNNAGNLVGLREHQNSALRGLRIVKGATPDYPLIESYYNRGFGTGIRQRGAGVVSQIKASGTYDIPSAYA